MEILRRDAATIRWKHYWDQMQEEWCKVEVFQNYSGEDNRPSLQAYLAGDPDRGLALLQQETQQSPWRDACRQKCGQGVTLRRIRILEEPYTPYTKWELEYFKLVNQPGGEQISVIDKNNLGGLSLPSGDVVIFDDQQAVVNMYDETMRMEEQAFYTDTESVAGFLALKDSLLELAVPL